MGHFPHPRRLHAVRLPRLARRGGHARGSDLVCIFIPAPAAKILALLSAAIIIFAHRENIKRLKNGTESKLSFGGKSKTDL